jgi:hypothetical protein
VTLQGGGLHLALGYQVPDVAKKNFRTHWIEIKIIYCKEKRRKDRNLVHNPTWEQAHLTTGATNALTSGYLW